VRAPRLALVVAEFNRPLCEAMLRSATAESEKLGAKVTATVRVPGSYETPLAAETLLRRSSTDALVVLGYIERGETGHGEVMGHVVHRLLVEASLRHDKPVGLGLIGPGATLRHAEKRKDEYARAAVRAAVRMLSVMVGLSGESAPKPDRKRRR
jgi:6,7-dimethyl-8-ribityllumazine synthase